MDAKVMKDFTVYPMQLTLTEASGERSWTLPIVPKVVFWSITGVDNGIMLFTNSSTPNSFWGHYHSIMTMNGNTVTLKWKNTSISASKPQLWMALYLV